MNVPSVLFLFCFFNDAATTEIYPLSLHAALPICAFDPNRRSPELGELRLDRADVPSPVGVVTRAAEGVRREQRALCRSALDADAEIDRDREHQPAAEVGELADQVHASRSPERARLQELSA